MRGIFVVGSALALACLTAHSSAEELQWRPVKKQATASRGGAASPEPSGKSNNAAVSISRPVPVSKGQPAGRSQLAPVSFNRVSLDPAQPVLFRAKSEQKKPQPIPSGPVLDEFEPVSSDDQEPPELPIPKPLPQNSTVVQPEGETSVHYPPGAIIYEETTVPGCDRCGTSDCCCGGGVCEPDWFCCGILRPWRRHFAGFRLRDNWCQVPRFWARAEYLAWWMKDGDVPPLATATQLNGPEIVALAGANPNFQPGALGNAGTVVIFDDQTEGSPVFSGGRFTLGFGIRPHWGVETTYFFLGETGNDFAASSTDMGTPGLFLPFVDANTNQQASRIVAFPVQGARLAGNIAIENNSRLWGIEFNVRKAWHRHCNWKLDILAGFRFVELNENLTVVASNVACNDPGNTGVFSDHFGTRNRFYGGQLGLDWEYRLCRWIFGVTGKVALGSVHQVALIDGSTAVTVGGVLQPLKRGGTYTQASNIGRFTQDNFAVVPEVGLRIGYQLTEHVSAFIAYNFLFISDVARPGDQIDFTIDPTQTVQRPAFNFNTSSFWAQGVNFGLECRY